jgi:hypothetical protein
MATVLIQNHKFGSMPFYDVTSSGDFRMVLLPELANPTASER